MPCTRKKMRSRINTVDPRLADVWHLRDRPSDVWDQRATKYRHQSLFETIATRFKSYHPDSQAQICTITGFVSGSVSGYV
ncbi:hypothetical protein DPMN_135009 [Dreissena polymorpha]|uniref:Uncharacterized protein n=1 Tax=Dreissena polymorpha TaxID=45954 RepID=A0A9D4G139_DREPO|nr:hypothetical protein DPMN_135009 [Dreissena polymorpha]